MKPIHNINMARSADSTKRIFQAFEGKTLSEVALIQSAYSRKDYNTIRQIMNKPSQSIDYIKGIGKWANQYVNALAQPNRTTKSVAKNIYGVVLKDTRNMGSNLTNNVGNLSKAPKKGKVVRGGGSIPLQTNYFLNIPKHESWDGFKMRIVSMNHYSKNQAITLLDEFRNRITKTFRTHNPRNLRKARLSIRYVTDSGCTRYISTKKVDISNFNSVIRKLNSYFTFKTLHAWSRLSPDIGGIINDFANGTDDIHEITDFIVEYTI